MKAEHRSTTWQRVALLAGLTLSLHAPVRAQEPAPSLSAETTSILGSPGAAAVLDTDVIAVLGKPALAAPSESAVNKRAAEIAAKLRCPVCQGVAISDSPSGMATKMREQVRDLVAKGYSEEQIMSYFERSYGEFVRLEPPARGLNLVLWILPGLVLAGGAWAVFRWASRPATAPAAGAAVPESRPEAAPVDPELSKYLDRIRRDSGTSS
jgi:cytochrome c-type biogenesis protein CcmH